MYSFDHSADEKELLILLQQSDQAAFTHIYNLYWKTCYFTAAQKLRNLSEAEEIVQDIFLDLWKRREELKISTCLSSYLFNCVKYRVINVLARRKLHLQYRQQVHLPDTYSSTEQSLRLHELKEKIFQETSKLPEKCRIIFQLSREQGYSQKQIARKLNISQKTVESHMSHALRSLRTGLGNFFAML